jgi:hypothetical protein
MAKDTGNPSPSPPGEEDPDANRATSSLVNWLGIGLTFLALLLAYLFASVWPSGFGDDAKGSSLTKVCLLWTTSVCGEFTVDVRILLMVMVGGGLGSFIHTATSFTDFVGNRQLARSWMWWYLLKPFIGMALAVSAYLVMRGGFLSVGTSAGTLNIYGIAALSVLTGMFSKQATDKLSEVFDTLFRTAKGGGDDKRKDDLGHVAHTLSDLEPSALAVGTSDLAFQVRGARFVEGSLVRIDGATRKTEFKSEALLIATLLPADVAKPGRLEVTVFNPEPGGGVSQPLVLRVGAAIAAATPPAAAGGAGSEHEDGCEVEVSHATPDEALPPALGGVSKP